MIDHNRELNLQAYMDGALSSGEADAVAKLLARDAEARSLFEELKATRALLVGNEFEHKLPDAREFYWSKIRRRIHREDQTQEVEQKQKESASSSWWLRFLAPAGALAALAVFVAVAVKNSERPELRLASGDSHEIETPLEETSSFSFQSETAGMTVVWVDSHRE